ncbi:MAG: helix-turn-helix transcriptional regulator [Lachnospiraceae bacterium]|nr:helix-turn-helix transcriptional regulator [Lachnospiraceae bacterium]
MFYDNIYKICKDKGTTPTTVLKELGYSTGNVTQWKKGSVPNAELCVAIARHLGITLDYLVTLSASVQNDGLSKSDQEWLDIISRIPEDKHNMCKDFLRTHMVVPEKYADEKKA